MKPRVPEFTLTEVVIAAGIAAGCSCKEMGVTLGISERWIYTQRDAHAAVIDQLATRLKTLIKVNKRQIKELSKAQAEEQLEKMLGHSIAVLQDALEAGDLNLAYQASKEIRDRALGRASQTVNLNARGRVEHVYITTPEALAALSAFDEDVVADGGLHGRARQLRGASVAGAIDIGPSASRDN
jgi:hypothetical protein